MERLISRSRVDLVGPGVEHGLAVEVVEVGEDPRFELILGCDANVAEHGPESIQNPGVLGGSARF